MYCTYLYGQFRAIFKVNRAFDNWNICPLITFYWHLTHMITVAACQKLCTQFCLGLGWFDAVIWWDSVIVRSRIVSEPRELSRSRCCDIKTKPVVTGLSLWQSYYHPNGWSVSIPQIYGSWWRHQMQTFCALLAICAGNSPVTGELFPAQRPVTWSFGVFFDLCLNKRLSIQWWDWWFETPSRPLWHQCNVLTGIKPNEAQQCVPSNL